MVIVTRPFHVGILVTDIHQAISKFESLLGVHFHTPRLMPYVRTIAGRPGPEHLSMWATYSIEGPMYLELCQSLDGDPGGTHDLSLGGERLHHIGAWAPNIDEQQRQVLSGGDVRVETEIRFADGPLRAWFPDPASVSGLRIEFIDAGLEPNFLWFREPVEPTTGPDAGATPPNPRVAPDGSFCALRARVPKD
jgi:hypothetical protein